MVGDGRAEGSAIGGGGQATTSLMPDVERIHVHILESSQFEDRGLTELKINYFVMKATLSHLLGTSQSTHWAYEKGKRKKPNQIALSEMLNISPCLPFMVAKKNGRKRRCRKENKKNLLITYYVHNTLLIILSCSF